MGKVTDYDSSQSRMRTADDDGLVSPPSIPNQESEAGKENPGVKQKWMVEGNMKEAREIEAVARAVVSDEDSETQWAQDMKQANLLYPKMEAVYYGIGEMLNEIADRLSTFNEPGLTGAFLNGLKAGIRPGDFNERTAIAELAKYLLRNKTSKDSRIAKKMVAGPKIVAIFPGENPRNPYMFYYVDDSGRVWYTMSPHSRGAVQADTYEEFVKMVMNGRVRALWVEDGEHVNSAPLI